MVTVLSGVATSLLIGGPDDEYLRMCAGLQPHNQMSHHQQNPIRSQNIYSQGLAPNHRYNAKASAIIHRCQMKNIHMRSQSMPEEAYNKQNLQLQQQQQQQQQQRQAHQNQSYLSSQQHPTYSQSKIDKRVSYANNSGSTSTNLRRSHTNAADLAGARLSAVQHFMPDRQRLDASTTSLNVLAARSRSNIAALNWNIGDSELHLGRLPTNLSRATSFYHRDYLQSAKSLGFLGPPSKDLSRPLHVDCSVEYDLGNQPKIPKNSAPLLIIHPAYHQRFQPYSSTIDSEKQNDYFVDQQRLQTSTPTARWQNCRYPSGYHNDYTHSSSTQQQQQQKLEFELTQSAPPKPQHRITRHSSFLVGGNVTSRQVTTQFRPIVHEDESLYFNYHHVHYPPRQYAPCLEATTMTEYEPYQTQTTIHIPNPAVKRSKSIHPTSSKGFHLSMPDISLEEGVIQLQQHMALRTNGQHQHPRSRARANLELKLEAARKMSTESHDSGTSLEMMSSFVDDEMLSPISTPSHKSDTGTGLQSQAFSDSGLGTPSSLMEQDGNEPGTSYSSSSSSSVSKWKTSVAGGSQVAWRAFVSSLKCMHF